MQSHVLHIYFLAAPDLLGAPSVIPLAKSHPDAVKMALRMKKLSNDSCDRLGGRTIHPDRLVLVGERGRAVRPEGFGKRVSYADTREAAKALADGPTFAHAMTKKMLHQEWAMGLDEAIEAEAQAQAICMQTKDYVRAYEAFVRKSRPIFEGN